MSRFDALSVPQVQALCCVAFGGEGASCNPRTLASLERLGLIDPVIERVRTPFGEMQVRKYEMSLATHVEFCAWCSEQADGLAMEGRP